jgi:hypothetical protein
MMADGEMLKMILSNYPTILWISPSVCHGPKVKEGKP